MAKIYPKTDKYHTRTYRIKQHGQKFYIEVLDILRIKPPWWKFWKARTWSEHLIWRICGRNGEPASMSNPGEFWSDSNPILRGFKSLEEAQTQIDNFKNNQVIAYYNAGGHEIEK